MSSSQIKGSCHHHDHFLHHRSTTSARALCPPSSWPFLKLNFNLIDDDDGNNSSIEYETNEDHDSNDLPCSKKEKPLLSTAASNHQSESIIGKCKSTNNWKIKLDGNKDVWECGYASSYDYCFCLFVGYVSCMHFVSFIDDVVAI